MADEKKPEGQEHIPPEGGASQQPPAPNQRPSETEEQKKIKDLENQLKERDTKISDLETTQATITARERQVAEEKLKQSSDTNLAERIKQINERRAYDPAGADTEFASLLAEQRRQAADDAVKQATQTISQQSALDKLRNGVKGANPDLDDELVDDIMAKANVLASTGKYRSADEAITAATKYVKGKLETYALKKNAVPPLPDGARAEAGGSNQPPPPIKPEKEKSPLEELEEANEAKRKRYI